MELVQKTRVLAVPEFLLKGMVYEEYSLYLGVMNNHQAEFHALIRALQICQQKGNKVISVRTDSQIVCDSVEKQFVKNKEFKLLLETAMKIIPVFDLFFIKWIPEKANKHADRLAKTAIRKNT